MLTTSSAWQSKNNASAKIPIYAFQIQGQSTVYTTHDLSALGVTNPPNYEPWLLTPQGASQSIDLINGSSSIGDLQCEVIDKGGAVRTLVGKNTLQGSTATLLVGYPGLDWVNDFVALHTYVLYKIVPTDSYTSFNFVCRDQQLLLKKTIYTHPENGFTLSTDNPWFLCGTPSECFQAIALFALGLPASAIDRPAMIDLDSPTEGIFAGFRPFLFQLTRSFEAKQFLETEIFKPSGLYCVVLNTGALSLRCMRPPAAGPSPVFTFTPDNTTLLPQFDVQPVVNEALWQFDYDGSEYNNDETFLQATSISQYGRGNQFNVQSSGLQTPYGAFGFTEWVSARLFKRFSGVAPGIPGGATILNVRAFLMTLPVWVGDYVAVTHDLMPDLTTGNLGITDRIYEVIERSPNYATGTMQYKLLDTGLTGQAAAYEWGSSSARPFLLQSSPVY
jgi:hypothetical protein